MTLPELPDALMNANKRKNARIEDVYYARSFAWLANNLPTATNDTAASAATNELVHTLNSAVKVDIPGLKIDRVSKGGSLGRRTLVEGDYDVDLQVLINGPMTYPDNWSRERLLVLLRQIRGYIDENLYPATVVEEGTQYDDVLQVTVGDVDADVLLVPNMVRRPDQSINRVAAQREALLEPLYKNPSQANADGTREAALAESLTEFVKGQQDNVKAVVRLLKAWYKYAIKPYLPTPPGGGGPIKVPSVALELLVLQAELMSVDVDGLTYEMKHSNMLSTFMRALGLLVDAVERGSVVAVNAGTVGYDSSLLRHCERIWRDDPVKIIHPIDPTCNVARPRKAGSADWKGLAEAAKTLLCVIRTGTLDELVCQSTLGKALQQLAVYKKERLPWMDGTPASGIGTQAAGFEVEVDYENQVCAASYRPYEQPQTRYEQPQTRYEQPQTRYEQPQTRYEQLRRGGCCIS